MVYNREPVYDRIGVDYADLRRADPRIAAQIDTALGDARTVVNVGAGAGSYEPLERRLVAVEPSAIMISQRPPDAAPAVLGVAEHLPLADDSVDAAMTVLSMHHWTDWRAGLAEMRRVARGPVVVFTWAHEHCSYWLVDEYLQGLLEWDAARFPAMEEMLDELPGASVEVVPIPRDCTDGFLAAYWARPETYLDPRARAAMSLFALAPDPEALERELDRLGADIESGAWEARHGALREQPSIDAGYRLVAFAT